MYKEDHFVFIYLLQLVNYVLFVCSFLYFLIYLYLFIFTFNALGGNDLFSEANQSLYEIKKEIRALKENLTRVAGGNCLVPEVKEQLSHIKEEIRALRQESGKGKRYLK